MERRTGFALSLDEEYTGSGYCDKAALNRELRLGGQFRVRGEGEHRKDQGYPEVDRAHMERFGEERLFRS